MGISDWSSDVCSSDLSRASEVREGQRVDKRLGTGDDATRTGEAGRPDSAPDRPAPDRDGAFGLPLPRDGAEDRIRVSLRRDRLLAALTLLVGAGVALATPFAPQLGRGSCRARGWTFG